jgi:hypothetical protein
MQNQFDNYPDAVPAELPAGSRWAWSRSDITAVYPTTAYTLKFRFSLLIEPYTMEEITAGKVSSAHVVTVSHDSTGGYAVGEYTWQAVVVRDSDSEEVVVDSGLVTVLADIGANPGIASSWVYQTLLAIRANLQAQASSAQLRILINGRELQNRTYTELLELERDFARRWQAERRALDRKAGRSPGGRVLVKMSA